MEKQGSRGARGEVSRKYPGYYMIDTQAIGGNRGRELIVCTVLYCAVLYRTTPYRTGQDRHENGVRKGDEKVLFGSEAGKMSLALHRSNCPLPIILRHMNHKRAFGPRNIPGRTML